MRMSMCVPPGVGRQIKKQANKKRKQTCAWSSKANGRSSSSFEGKQKKGRKKAAFFRTYKHMPGVGRQIVARLQALHFSLSGTFLTLDVI